MANNESTYTLKGDFEHLFGQQDKAISKFKEIDKLVSSIGASIKDIGKFNVPIPGFAKGGAPSDSDSGSSTDHELDTRHKRSELEHFKDFKDYNKTFKPYAAEVKQFTRGVMGLGTSLLKFAAGGALGAAGGFFGAAMPLAKSAVEDRRQALYLGGANIGKMKAAGTAFGNIMNVPETLGKISEGQFDITSPSYLALKMLKFSDAEIQGSDPSDLLAKALTREQKRAKTYSSDQTAITMENSLGGTNLFGAGTIKALRALPTGELEGKEKDYVDRQKTLDLTVKEQQAMDELVSHVNNAGQQIETVMVRNLAKMEPYLVHFSDWVTDFVVNRIPHEEGKTAEKFGENTVKDVAIPIYKWLFGGEKDKGSEGSWEKSIIEDFNKGWDKLFGKAEDKWAPFFNDLEKEWKAFFDKMVPMSPSDLPTLDVQPQSLEVNGGGNFVVPGGGRNRSLRARGTGGGGGGNFGDIDMPAGAPRGKTGREPGLFATNVGLIASKGYAAADAALLDTFATGETPGGSYSNVDHDRGGLGGRYQFLKSSWVTWAKNAGLDPKNFSAEGQDRAALLYAETVIKQKTGKSWLELSKTPEGVARAIGALSPGVWNGIGNVDPDKHGHSGAVRLFLRKQQEEAAASAARSGVATTPAPVAAKKEHQSLMNMSHFQQDKKLALRINNAAGANYVVSSGMLGSGSGSYG